MDIIIVSGKPGAGKGTWLSRFMEKYSNEYEVLSTGQIIRSMLKQQTPLAEELRKIVTAGKLVSDEIVNKLVEEAIRKTDKNVILDGYPRTVGQAKEMLNNKLIPTKVINLDVEDLVIMERAKDRVVCSNCGESYTLNAFKPPKKRGFCDKCGGTLLRREDDNPEVVKERLRVYRENTQPILDFFYNNGIDVINICGDNKEVSKAFNLAILS